MLIGCLMVFPSCGVSSKKPTSAHTKTITIETSQNPAIETIKTGADNYSEYLPLLKDKKLVL